MSNVSLEEFLEKHDEWRRQQGDWCRVMTKNGPVGIPVKDLDRLSPEGAQKLSDEEGKQFASDLLRMLADYRSRRHGKSSSKRHAPRFDPSCLSHDPKYGFLPIFGKDSYLSYREKFMQIYPFDDCLGKKNPYTGTTVSTQSDYEVYCVSRYLKHVAEEEIIDLQAQY